MSTDSSVDTAAQPQLKRVMGPGLLLLFVVGDILGTGVYALTGDVAAEVGGAAWVPFLVAFLIATVTAFSYLELVTKYPQAAGAALYAHKAFGVQFVTFLVAFIVMCSGITSASTASRFFAANFFTAFDFSWGKAGVVAVALLFMAALAVVNFRGVGESVKLNVVLTIIEITGLVLVILAALPDLFDGALAKASNTSSQRGAFFDSVIDRVTDALLFGGVAWYFASEESPHMSLLPFAVLGVSSVISYQRAKAESLGLDAKEVAKTPLRDLNIDARDIPDVAHRIPVDDDARISRFSELAENAPLASPVEVGEEDGLQHVPLTRIHPDALLQTHRHGLGELVCCFDEVLVEPVGRRPVTCRPRHRREDVHVGAGPLVVQRAGQQGRSGQQRDGRRSDGHLRGLAEELDLHAVPAQIPIRQQCEQAVAAHQLDELVEDPFSPGMRKDLHTQRPAEVEELLVQPLRPQPLGHADHLREMDAGPGTGQVVISGVRHREHHTVTRVKRVLQIVRVDRAVAVRDLLRCPRRQPERIAPVPQV